MLHRGECNGRYKNLREDVYKFDTEKKDNSVRFVCISDTHNKTKNLHNELPEGDVLIHAGILQGPVQKNEITDFNEYLGKVKSKFKHIVVIAGNHELSFDQKCWNKGGMKMSFFKVYFGKNPLAQQLNPNQSKQLLTNCTYIEDETVELYA